VPGRDAGRPHPALAARGVGNVVVLLGRKTGRDGIGGVSVLASATFDADGPARRPSVQVGDPFTEKLLIEACLEMYDAKLVQGIQDLGGAGLTCALTETAAAGKSGMLAHLDRVPLREASMEPHEVLASESQERMLAIVAPEDVPAVLAVADKWGVLATAIGEVVEGTGSSSSGTARSSSTSRPARWPTTDRSTSGRSSGPPTRTTWSPRQRPRTPRSASSRPAAPDGRLAEPLQPPLGGRAVRPDRARRHRAGLAGGRRSRTAVGVRARHRAGDDGNGRYARLDPYAGAQLALAEAYRNVARRGRCRSRSRTA
jgi:phosphoribosylformylglycinamidine synthase